MIGCGHLLSLARDEFFRGKNTERGLFLFIVRHGAEHLGRSIAYAGFVGLAPP